jgi:hypothetical protein
MLKHFQVPFSVVHDLDWPYTKDGAGNGMWTINQSIYEEIVACRAAKIAVRHRCSVPDFERYIGGEALGKDKPLAAYVRVNEDEALREKLQNYLVDVCDSDDHEPFGALQDEADYLEHIKAVLKKWNADNGEPNDIRLIGNAK